MERLAKNLACSMKSVSITKLHMVTPCHFSPYCTSVDSFFLKDKAYDVVKCWPGTSERLSSTSLLNVEIIDRHHHPDPELLTTSRGSSTASVSILLQVVPQGQDNDHSSGWLRADHWMRL